MNGLLLVDVSAQDSTAVDTTTTIAVADSIPDGMKFIYRPPASNVSQIPAVKPGRLYYLQLSKESYETRWDSADTYTVQRKINGVDLGAPSIYSFEQFAREKKQQQIKEIQSTLVEEGKEARADQRGLLDFSLEIPGGQSSVFTTIFGKPEVNLRVNGSANMNVGVSIQNVDDPTIDPDLQRRIDPTFNQNLQLNIQGTIGDKLTIATDWDTERAFDFQNRLSIVYEGYEDEIIKRIEMGNVSMETGNSLIRGGASLFGIKSIAELGPLKLTSVVSQQKGESESETITGGSQETPISIRPVDYQNNRHFFIDFYNRQEFEGNVENPQSPSIAYQISDIKVWISEPQINTTDPEAVRAAAFAELGVVQNGDGEYGLPNPAFDSIDENLLDQNRGNTSASAGDFNVSGNDFYNGFFRPLQEGADYTVNRSLGYISLNRTLSPGSFLAVSFVRNGVPGESQNVIEVGDINAQSSGLTYLKLLRSDNPTPDQTTWPLTLRNVYSLGVSNLTPDGLELGIKFTQGNVDDTNLPNRSSTLLQDLGLDRTDTGGNLNPDNIIDFSSYLFNPGTGVVVFPYLEPFGERIASLLEETGASDSVIQSLAYTEVYNEKQNTADENSKNDYYQIEGIAKGGVSGNFTLGFSLVEGSVKVFANGTELTEGVDYEVDYSFGSITILNEQYLAAGQDIQIEYENNQLNQIGQKNFTGVRAEYQITENISVGGTYFRLKEQPLSDKIRVENESINNTILGMDASADFDTPWLTRAIDKVPLLQTKAPSNISFSGEFAQLRPDVAQTNAVREAIDNGELYPDEENGLSFVDDFEGSEVSISLSSATRWDLAAAPAAIPGYAPDEAFFDNPNAPLVNTLQSKIARSDLRSQFSWYTIPRNISSLLGGVDRTPESERVLTERVFPGRETNNAQEEELTTLDVYYNPSQRGPYNYNFDLKNKLENEPENQWGGMTAVLPSGQEDLTQNNIEFIEFWVQPVLPGGEDDDPANYDGKIYIEIGTISEDVVPNFDLNSEDGLATNPANLEQDNISEQARSYVPSNAPAPQGQFSNENRELEDVGLDGVPSRNGFDDQKVETALFREFVDSMRVAYGPESPEFRLIEQDPSNDDYIYYGENQAQELPLHERFHRVLGYHEGNTPVAGGSDNKRAITPRPDSEGLKSRATIETNNNYYQYEVNFNPAEDLQIEINPDPNNRTFIVDKVPGERQQDRWHLVRIPLSEFKRKVGEIDGFQNISHIRMWMSGYEKPFTLRFATFEFIGNQWRKVDNIDETATADNPFRVSTINIEENANREPVPYRQPEGSIRALNRGVQINTLENEQSIVLGVEDLGPGEIQMIKRVYPGGLDLLNYSNMRMFVHGEGYYNESKEDKGRRDAELVIRMGTDLNTNYYEYRQPVTPSDINYDYSTYSPDGGSGQLALDAEQVWLYDENSMNILLAAFNELKQIREQRGVSDINQRFELPLSTEEYDAVEGAVIAIKGNPSLGRVGEIGMGVRNPYDPADPNSPGSPSLNAEFWLNELRLSGFDNEKGWKANAKASFKMADFATINTNFTRTTTGYGGLDSRLGNRSVSDEFGYDLNSTVNLHKLVPDRFGWTFPVSISTRRNASTPKFLPNQGDIRTEDFINATNNNEDLSEAEKQTIIDERLSDIETVRESFSFNMSNISKSNSNSKLAQLTLDNTRLSYVYNEGSLKNPEIQFQDDWNYTSSISYNLSLNNVKLWQPFRFMEDASFLSILSRFRLGYMPSSINASASLNRSYNERRRRPQLDSEGVEQIQALQQTQTFNHKSSFGLNYNLTPNIPISFRTNTNFDLSEAGRLDIPRTEFASDSSSYQLRSSFDVIEGIFTDTLNARRSNYQETYTASWRPKFNTIDPLSWITYSASYSGGYGWTNSASGSGLGAGVSNTFRLDHTLKLGVGNLLNRLDFFEQMKETDQQETRERRREKENGNNNNQNGEETAREPDLVKDVQFLARKMVLALFSMQNIDITYNDSKTSNQAGYRGGSQIFYAFSDPDNGQYSPPLGYRIGLTEELPRSQLLQETPTNNSITIPKNNTYSDKIGVGTKLNIFSNISLDLTWNTQWDERVTDNITLTPAGDFSSTVSSSGNIASSVWAFGPGYGDLFERQLQTAFDDLNAEEGIIRDDPEAGGNGDGRVLLNRNTLADDFRYAYLGAGTSAIGEKGYTPIPKPNWRLTWSGVEKIIPFIGDAMNAASLTHSYQGNYRLGWNLNATAGNPDQEARGQGIGSVTYFDEKALNDVYDPQSINVEQRFSPLIQLNVTWKSDLRTQISVDRSRTTSLALSSKTVTERTSQGLSATINYTFRNLTLPFFPEIKNNVDLSLSGGIADDSEKKFNLTTDLDDALSGTNIVPDVNQYDFTDPFETGQTRINASLNLGYRFSQTVTSNFEYTFTNVSPKSSAFYPRTNHEIRFNFRIAIQSR